VTPTSANITVGGTQQLTASFGPSGCSPQPSISWSNGGSSVASVSASGLVTAGNMAGGPINITATAGSLMAMSSITVTAAPSLPNIVISQVYGAGGNSGATYTNDFVELKNNGTTAVSLSGLSIQYTSATGTGNFSSNVTTLSGTIGAGGYFLVQMSSGGSAGTSLPAADATGTLGLAATAGKVILVNSATGLACNSSTTCSSAQIAQIIDLVGYGTANYFEGSGAAPAPSTTNATVRKGNGCIDTNNNNSDFLASPVSPKNSATSPVSCP
jgi:uncharacterized protein